MSADCLEELIVLFIERREAGETLSIDQFMVENKSHGQDLREALLSLARTESMFTSGDIDQLQQIGPYRLLQKIGQGGMGMVFEAEKEPGKKVAIKLLDLASHLNPRAIKRLSREGDILKRLNHPNIVRVLDTDENAGSPFIVMELLDGISLARVVTNSAAESCTPAEYLAARQTDQISEPWAAAVLLVEKLARAVSHAHDVGLLHRDIKPSNVMVNDCGEPTLLDFGLARDQEASTLTYAGDLLGTPIYMAPEQAKGEPVTAATDIYGLGALLFELLTGQTMITSRDPIQIIELVSQGKLASLHSVWPQSTKKLEAIVSTATALAPAARYFSAMAFAEDLNAVAHDRPVQAKLGGVFATSFWSRIFRRH